MKNNKKRRVKRGPYTIATRTPQSRFVSATLPSVASSITNSWTLYEPTNLIRVGADFSQRIGRQIRLTRLNMKGMLVGGQSNLATDDPRNVVRIVIALVDGSFDATSMAALTLSTPITNQNVTGLLKIYADRLYNLRVFSRDSTGYVPCQLEVSVSTPLNALVHYNDSIGGFSPVPRVYVMFLSDSAVVSNPGFVSGFIQLCFANTNC